MRQAKRHKAKAALCCVKVGLNTHITKYGQCAMVTLLAVDSRIRSDLKPRVADFCDNPRQRHDLLTAVMTPSGLYDA